MFRKTKNTEEVTTPRFPRNILTLPLIFGVVVVLFNLQWMRIYHLINSPSVADSLVYLTEAFNDFWAFRENGIGELIKKYIAGNQQTSPLLWWLAGIMFLLLGPDPINAYIVIGLAYLLWIAGVSYLAWQLRPDRVFAIACGLMAVFLPSAVSHGLRNFMLDFVAAAPFVWSTAFLLKSNLFSSRKFSMFYGLMCGLTILFRTTSVLFFLGHAAIILCLSIMHRRHPRYHNMILVVLVVLATCGWFIFTNISRILGYYSYWAQEAVKTQVETSFFSNFVFYLHLLPSFHFSVFIFKIYLCFILVAFTVLLFIKYVFKRKLTIIFQPFLVLILMAGVPTLVLSSYSSRAATVDYPFIAAYLIFPVLLWRTILIRPRIAWVPLAILISVFAVGQAHYLFRAQTHDSLPVYFREREAIQMILNDAEHRGLSRVKIGNTCIHRHNCLSYKYWILSNYFPNWRGRMDLAQIGRANSAEELAEMNANSDYVITLENYLEQTHPNNRFAPEANSILKIYGMRQLGQPLDLPDGTTLNILWNPNHVEAEYQPPASDGWHENQLPVVINSTGRENVTLIINAELFPLSKQNESAVITIQSVGNRAEVVSFKSNFQVSQTVVIPGEFFDTDGKANLIFTSSWAYNPEDHMESPERRNLAFRNLIINVKMPANKAITPRW